MPNNSQELLKEIKTISKKNGVEMVGATKIRMVESVIVFGFPCKWQLKDSLNFSMQIKDDYKNSRQVLDLTSDVLHQEGFRADYKTLLSLFGDFRPLAVAAGLGYWGRNGLVVSNNHRAGLIFAALFTNAPLESNSKQTIDQKVLGHPQCNICDKCVQICPANAFQDNNFDYQRCLPYAARGCAECLRVCFL